MKRLKFKHLLMSSLRDKTARKITFDPRMTVIKGINDTGKSSLIKTIYRSLGAEPPNIHSKWEDSNVSSALIFELNENEYTMLRHGDTYCLFDKQGEIVKKFNSITTQLSPFYANLFAFKLLLNSSGKEKQATPAFLFLPFYLDQDKSWGSAWSGFEKLQQFSAWTTDLVYYHTGIRPNEYFEAKEKKTDKTQKLDGLVQKQSMLESISADLQLRLKNSQCDLDIVSYKKEIETLLIKCNAIKNQEEVLKKDLTEYYNAQCVINAQIEIAENAIDEISKDYKFAEEQTKMHVCCPICNAEYTNSFAERFAIAQDEDQCRELLLELRDKLSHLNKQIYEVSEKFTQKHKEFLEIESILQTKQGDITLKELIENEGKKELQNVLRRDIQALDESIGELQRNIKSLDKEMKKSLNKDKTAEIKQFYLCLMKKYLWQLNVVTLPPSEYETMTGRFKEGGSDHPRALLAYYFSILHTIDKFSTATFCPIVIDSPKQQDQDEENWKGILKFIKSNLPEYSQVILGTVDTSDLEFDGQIIELTDKYQMLSRSDYNNVMEVMRPLIDKCLRHE